MPSVEHAPHTGSKKESGLVKAPKEVLLWAGEKSPYVTIPLTGVIFVAGAITLPLAAGLIGVDIAQNKVFKGMRERRKKK